MTLSLSTLGGGGFGHSVWINKTFIGSSQEPRSELTKDAASKRSSTMGHGKSDIKWKLAGDLGGKYYGDQIRSLLNEGRMRTEQQSCHFPEPPTAV
ncbi:hypothetical protein GGS21DRAFT_491973 [Xylaria nigripes]|nr:hypothetical protein GGS21DRAFT_491973 [Xylaria nigripes]